MGDQRSGSRNKKGTEELGGGGCGATDDHSSTRAAGGILLQTCFSAEPPGAVRGGGGVKLAHQRQRERRGQLSRQKDGVSCSGMFGPRTASWKRVNSRSGKQSQAAPAPATTAWNTTTKPSELHHQPTKLVPTPTHHRYHPSPPGANPRARGAYLDQPGPRHVPDVARQGGVLVAVGLGGQDDGALGAPPKVPQGPQEAPVLLEHNVHFLRKKWTSTRVGRGTEEHQRRTDGGGQKGMEIGGGGFMLSRYMCGRGGRETAQA